MENYSYSSYPDSGNSSPRSREIDCENQAWEEPANYRVKFMCSFGGKIHPRPHDNQLAYVGGDTKILTIDRNIKFSGMLAKLSSLWDTEVCFKYQLPGEDLDALISVTNDEDLEHMMLEYDRLHRTVAKPARLRLFLFPLNPLTAGISPADQKPDQQWFVDALNSAPVQSISLPESSSGNPDFLFGFDKGSGGKHPESASEHPVSDASPVSSPSVIDARDCFPAGPDVLKDQQIGEAVVSGVHPAEIQRQIHEFQRLQIASQEQQAATVAAFYQRKQEESLARAFPDSVKIQVETGGAAAGSIAADYYMQKAQEKARFEQAPQAVAPPPPTIAQQSPAAYWQERQVTGSDQPFYLVHSGGYPANFRPVASQVGQGFYTMPRMPPPASYMPESYRDPAFYGMSGIGAYPEYVVRQDTGTHPVAARHVSDTGFTAMPHPSTGGKVVYTMPAPGVPSYQNITATPTTGDVRQMQQVTQETKVAVTKPPSQP